MRRLWGSMFGLRRDIVNYIDGNGLVAPYVVPSGMIRASDNGVQFTSEYYMLLLMRGELNDNDVLEYSNKIFPCISLIDNELHRAPGDESPDETDDYHGALATHIKLGLVPLFKVPFRLWRQPQLLAMSAIASRNIFKRFLALPLIAYASLVLATSCIGVPPEDTDARRCSWFLLKGIEGTLMGRIAGWFWKRRLLKTYPEGMKTVSTIYYQAGHPLAEYALKF